MRFFATVVLSLLMLQSFFFFSRATPPQTNQETKTDGRQDFSKLKWEVIEQRSSNINDQGSTMGYLRSIERAKVFGGWLVRSTLSDSTAIDEVGIGQGSGAGLTFIPDSRHQWKLE